MKRALTKSILPSRIQSPERLKKQNLFDALRMTKYVGLKMSSGSPNSIQLNPTLGLKHFTLYVSFWRLAFCVSYKWYIYKSDYFCSSHSKTKKIKLSFCHCLEGKWPLIIYLCPELSTARSLVPLPLHFSLWRALLGRSPHLLLIIQASQWDSIKPCISCCLLPPRTLIIKSDELRTDQLFVFLVFDPCPFFFFFYCCSPSLQERAFSVYQHSPSHPRHFLIPFTKMESTGTNIIDTYKLILKFMWKDKGSRMAKTVLKKDESGRNHITQNFKIKIKLSNQNSMVLVKG